MQTFKQQQNRDLHKPKSFKTDEILGFVFFFLLFCASENLSSSGVGGHLHQHFLHFIAYVAQIVVVSLKYNFRASSTELESEHSRR